MEKLQLTKKLYAIENIGYKLLNHIFSFTIGFIISKADFNGEFSPFSLSLLSFTPFINLSVIFVYLGSFLGFLTKVFSIHNFKYICANTIMLTITLIVGSKNYKNKIYSPLLTGFISFSVGILFLFANDLSITNSLLVLCEAVFCTCITFFGKYFTDAFLRKSKLNSQDIISFYITLLVILYAVDQYYIYSFSVSMILVFTIFFISIHYLEQKTTALFTLPLCIALSLMRSNLEYFMLILYVPILISTIISKFEKKYLVPSFYIPYITLFSLNGLTLTNLSMALSPLISAIFYYFVPKQKFSNFLSKFVVIQNVNSKKTHQNNNEICETYLKHAFELLNKIEDTTLRPVFNIEIESKFKKYLFSNGCRDIQISNFYNGNNKQIIALEYKTEKNLPIISIQRKLISITDKNFIVSENINNNDTYKIKFEQSEIYKVECFALFKAKKGENICGDCVTAFKSPQSEYNLILTDGMGSGKQAFCKSNDTINIIKKLLKSGISPKQSIKIANSSISLIKDEIGFSTVDLCCISLDTATAQFIKCGAYLSYIVRGNQLITINSGGYPPGLTNNISFEQTTIQLEDNDLIAMFSDGIANVIDKIQARLLINDRTDIELLTKQLMDCAVKETPLELDDDISIMIARIKQRNNV